MKWPLGTREDMHTEFKRVEALKNPGSIAREVVGFLNMEGGKIWIGFGETDGVADSIEPVLNAGSQADRLRDALVDLIEPAPAIGREVDIKLVRFPADESRGVLVVEVKPGERRPYALLRQGARAYLKRTGSRLRAYTHEELADDFIGSEKSKGLEADALKKMTDQMIGWSTKFTGLKVIVRPVDKVNLELASDVLLPLLQIPGATGNRPLGWNFSRRRSELKTLAKGYRFGEKDSAQWLEISESGEVQFSVGLERMEWKGGPKNIWPFALLEFPTSVLRLVRTLYAQYARPALASDAKVTLALGLFGIRGWTLGPYSPASMDYQFSESFSTFDETDDFLGEPVIELWEDLAAMPDRSAYRLTRQVYRAFGHDEQKIPAEYNREEGQLNFQA
jgi:Putative DNA-binding domain